MRRSQDAFQSTLTLAIVGFAAWTLFVVIYRIVEDVYVASLFVGVAGATIASLSVVVSRAPGRPSRV